VSFPGSRKQCPKNGREKGYGETGKKGLKGVLRSRGEREGGKGEPIRNRDRNCALERDCSVRANHEALNQKDQKKKEERCVLGESQK